MKIKNCTHKVLKRSLAIVLLCSLHFTTLAQVDSNSAPVILDSLVTPTEVPPPVATEPALMVKAKKISRIDTVGQVFHNPGKAAMYAAVFPGLGQIYNKKYWKLPLVYGALGAGIYAITFNHDQYKIYLDGFYTRIDDNPVNDQFVGVYDERQLIELQNIYRRWRDLSIILTGVAYGLQILDAYVDAHLFYFDVSDDLTLNWQPSILSNQYAHPNAFGLGITLSFK